MRSLRKAYHMKIVHLSALFLTLFFSLASLVSCSQPPPPYTSINLGIPAAALQSPVKGPLPDTTQLNVGITFKIDPRLLNQADHQKLLSCIHFKGHLSFINVDGAPSDAAGESTLDVQIVAELYPSTSIHVYQTDGNPVGETWTHWNDELHYIS